MCASIVLDKKYSISQNSSTKGYTVEKRYSCKSVYEDTYRILSELNITSSLDSDLDVFTNLPDFVYDNKDASIFLQSLRKAIIKENPKDITLAKMIVTEKTETGFTLEWIYNYFRIYFSFDSEDGNFFGCISHNGEDGYFKNEFKPMKVSEFDDVAEAILDYVIMMIQG
jgi:hypothetical protein